MKPSSAPAPAPMRPNGAPSAKPVRAARSTLSVEVRGRVPELPEVVDEGGAVGVDVELGWVVELAPVGVGALAVADPGPDVFGVVAHPVRSCRLRTSVSVTAMTLAEVFLTEFQKPPGAPDVDLNCPVEPTHQPLAVLG